MGALLDVFGYRDTNQDPQLDIPDPVTSLTPRDRKHVTDTWRIVQQDFKTHGVELFIRLFQAYPETQNKFPGFVGIPLDELRKSKRLLAHTNGVMYALTSVVDNLNDPECLTEMLKTLGRNHARRKVMEQHFHALKGILLSVLKDGLGEALTPQAEESWSKTIDVAYKGIFQGLNESPEKNREQSS